MDSKATEVAKDAVEKEVSKTEPILANTLSLVKPGKDRHEVVALVANKVDGTDKEAGQASQGLLYDVFNVTGAGSSYKILPPPPARAAQVRHLRQVPVPNFHVSPVYNGVANTARPGLRASAPMVKNASDGERHLDVPAGTALAKSAPNTTSSSSKREWA